jgi:hypothetical protein
MITAFFSNPVARLSIASNQQNYDLFTALGSPTAAKTFVLTIESGVTISSATPATPALYGTSDLPAGSILKIINSGVICGAGGTGGTGGTPSVDGTNGVGGGDAIRLLCDTVINNASGSIYGGGGGGGGSAGVPGSFWGGGGGGGAGIVAGTGGTANATYAEDGEDGTSTTGGEGGGVSNPNIITGGSGGDLGEAGSDGLSGETISGGTGGAAGAAINKNSYILTATGGFNAAQIKGPY